MKKNLLVTLADENYLERAKQLFSSVYWNAGWKGDYMLLAHEVPEERLKWFRDKGILVKKCKAIYNKDIFAWPPIMFTKFYLFTPYFKKWGRIVYLDTDIIVRASLERLCKINGFGGCKDLVSLEGQFVDRWAAKKIDAYSYWALVRELKKHYCLKSQAFNAGVMAFDTRIIEDNTFDKLIRLLKKYEKALFSCDQAVLNLRFYKKWANLPLVYNIRANEIEKACGISQKEVRGIIIHSYQKKPWQTDSFYYKEWNKNLEKAELIDLKNIPQGKRWTEKEIKEYCSYLKKRRILFYPAYAFFNIPVFMDITAGKIGVIIRKISPGLYNHLKIIKKHIGLEKEL